MYKYKNLAIIRALDLKSSCYKDKIIFFMSVYVVSAQCSVSIACLHHI